MLKSFKLSTILTVISVLISTCFAIIFVVWSYYSTIDSIDTDKKQYFENSQKITQIALNDYIRSINESLKHIFIEEDQENEILAGNWETFIDHSDAFIDERLDILLLQSRLDGEVRDLSFNVLGTNTLIRHLHSKPITSEPITLIGIPTDEGTLYFLLFTKKITLPSNGQVAADLIAGIVLNGNFKLLNRIKNITQSKALALADTQHVISISEPPNSPLDMLIQTIYPEMTHHKIQHQQNLLLSMKPLLINNKTSHLNIVYITSDTIFSALESNLINLILVMAISIILLILFYIMFVNKIIIKPLFNLEEFAKKTAHGSHNVRFKQTPVSEFNEIGENLEEMISAIKNLNLELEKRVLEEVENVRQKDQIIYEQNRKNALNELLVNIAHHWRQPLNYIALEVQSIQDIVEEEANPESVDKKISNIMRELKSLSQIISDFTDFYRARESRLRAVSTIECLKKSEDFFGSMLRNAHVKIIYPENDQDVHSTKGDMVEIFTALLLNVRDITMIRKLPSSEIKISLKKNQERVVIVFEDNAGGIDTEIFPTLFDPYSTSQFKSRNKGLSLFTIKNIIEKKLNGTIEAENIDSGAKFIITLNGA